MTDDPTIPALIDLRGQRALVTGGAKGIGAAISSRLAEAGAHVTIADLDDSAGDTASALVGRGLEATFVRCDITDAGDVAAAVRASAGPSGLRILVNNAGIFPTTGLIDAVTDAFVHPW